ncbi:MAG TPA: hypothetical protein VNE63_12850 [Candidatus Acidoferrales bacterium]|nr:hypothetical protein [Candidatus Acidoferrales bacterium]
MAKGWESKSVADQIEASVGTDQKSNKQQLTLEQVEAHRRMEVLLLSRARVERALQGSQNPRYRDQLMRALADLDAQISAMKHVGA